MVSIIIALIIVIFAVQNAAVVPVQFLLWSTELPLVLVIFCSVFAGALLMFCLALWKQLKNKMGKRSKIDLKVNKKEDNNPIEISDNPRKTDNNDSINQIINTPHDQNSK